MVNLPFKKSKETPLPTGEVLAEKKGGETVEVLEVKEATETQATQTQEQIDQGMQLQENMASGTTPPVSQAVSIPVDPLTQKIESILEEDLTDHYLSMKPADQVRFKQKGEETLSKIRMLVSQTKVNAKKIFQLIREWLKIIPGVNRFFLEQEAKIKTDKILLTKEQK